MQRKCVISHVVSVDQSISRYRGSLARRPLPLCLCDTKLNTKRGGKKTPQSRSPQLIKQRFLTPKAADVMTEPWPRLKWTAHYKWMKRNGFLLQVIASWLGIFKQCGTVRSHGHFLCMLTLCYKFQCEVLSVCVCVVLCICGVLKLIKTSVDTLFLGCVKHQVDDILWCQSDKTRCFLNENFAVNVTLH